MTARQAKRVARRTGLARGRCHRRSTILAAHRVFDRLWAAYGRDSKSWRNLRRWGRWDPGSSPLEVFAAWSPTAPRAARAREARRLLESMQIYFPAAGASETGDIV